MVLTIYQIDAFADAVFKGNPAAVIPLESWIDEGLMQQIAMENNLSETVFFCPLPTSPGRGGEANAQPSLIEDVANKSESLQSKPRSEALMASPPGGGWEGADYHIRWFTPDYEIDLCGHATLASAYVIKNFIQPHLQEISFSTQKAGVLKTTIKDGVYTLEFPARMPQPCAVPEGLLQSIGVSTVVEVLRSRDYFVVLPDEEAVRNIEPDYNLMKTLDTIGVIVTAKGSSADVVSRCFYPGAGIPEDPVTGSAHCNIVPYWAQKLGKTKLFCKQLSPRGGDLHCEVAGDRVLMSGTCILFMKGEIILNEMA